MRSIATIVSVLLHPLFVPVYLMALLTEIDVALSMIFYDDLQWRFILSLSITMIIGPLAGLIFLKHRGVIDSLTMPTLHGRSVVLGVVLMSYIFVYVLLVGQPMPRLVMAMIIGLMVTVLLLMIISLRYKISAHMAAMGGAVACLLWLGTAYGIWHTGYLCITVLLSGMVGTARLVLDAHDNRQLLLGFILGGLSIYGALTFLML